MCQIPLKTVCWNPLFSLKIFLLRFFWFRFQSWVFILPYQSLIHLRYLWKYIFNVDWLCMTVISSNAHLQLNYCINSGFPNTIWHFWWHSWGRGSMVLTSMYIGTGRLVNWIQKLLNFRNNPRLSCWRMNFSMWAWEIWLLFLTYTSKRTFEIFPASQYSSSCNLGWSYKWPNTIVCFSSYCFLYIRQHHYAVICLWKMKAICFNKLESPAPCCFSKGSRTVNTAEACPGY